MLRKVRGATHPTALVKVWGGASVAGCHVGNRGALAPLQPEPTHNSWADLTEVDDLGTADQATKVQKTMGACEGSDADGKTQAGSASGAVAKPRPIAKPKRNPDIVGGDARLLSESSQHAAFSGGGHGPTNAEHPSPADAAGIHRCE